MAAETMLEPLDDELLPEYDEIMLQKGIRGKYVERYRTGTNIIVLDDDVAQAFPNTQAVNDALRLLLKMAELFDANIQERQGVAV